jgi:hypothetical protein
MKNSAVVVMTYVRSLIVPLFLAILAILLASCGGAEEVPISIDCHVFYRASSTESFSESTIRLSRDGDVEHIEFDDLGFNASYLDDEFDARALAISITALDSGDEISRQLNQMDRGEPLINQFIGGHGFTGLMYVYHPSSSGELQYFCESS